MNINYTTFDLNTTIGDVTITNINRKLKTKNEYLLLDSFYVMCIKNHHFDSPYITNQNIFKKKLIHFIKSVLDRCYNTNVTNGDKYEVLIHHTDIISAFHTTNYTIAVDFLYSIGFMKKKVMEYNNGKIQYYKRPTNDCKGIITTYIVTPVRQYNQQFAFIELPKDKKQFQNFKVQLSKTELNTLKHTQLDRKAALKAEFYYYNNSIDKNINSLYKRINCILSFGEKVYTTRGDKSQRVFHNLSNLSSVSRKYLSHKGESFYNIDLKNSQILFLVSYCKKNNLPLDQNFKDDVLDGIIYDRFYGTGEFGTDRKKVKQELFRTVFFDFKIKEEYNQVFKRMYPLAWTTIQSIHDQYKGNDKCNLAILLQNVEHDAFINIPMISNAYFNLFDSIYCTAEADIDTIHQHLKQYFISIGIDRFQVTINQ